MIKASGALKDGRRFIIFGLSRLNTEKLLEGKPIRIDLREPPPAGLMVPDGMVIGIMGGETEAAIASELHTIGVEVPVMSYATEKGKDAALAALQLRREHKPVKVDNAGLPAGCPLFYYCIACGAEAAKLPEDHIRPPPALCDECEALKVCGWLE